MESKHFNSKTSNSKTSNSKASNSKDFNSKDSTSLKRKVSHSSSSISLEDNSNSFKKPRLESSLQKTFQTQIFTKENHILCLTENNLCYVWGGNNCGKLGLGDFDDRSYPTLFSLPNNERISFITCGWKHTICLTENNLCYVWGKNNYGELFSKPSRAYFVSIE